MTESVSTGADAVAAALDELGVEIVFGITGAGNLAICDAIHRRGKSRMVFMHHEQAALMAAQGLARTTGRLGVVVVTTGGGSTNAVTGIASANMDSIPILVISGNESSVHVNPDNELRVWGIQGFDSRAVFSHVAKESHRARTVDQIHDLVVSSARIALEPRRGVVTIDIPMDLQRRSVTTIRQPVRRLVAAAEASARPQLTDALDVTMHAVEQALKESARPVLLLGAGLRTGLDRKAIRDYVAKLGIPTVLSWSGIDLLDAAHPSNFGRTGLYGDRYANMIVQNSDLVISIGSRLAIPQLSYDPLDYGRDARIIVVDIDQRELDKFVGERWVPVLADAGDFLTRLSTIEQSVPKLEQWGAKCSQLRSDFPRRDQTAVAIPAEGRADFVNSYDVVYEISDQAGGKDLFVTDQGTGLLSGFYGLDVNEDQMLTTSLGLGEMGFGLPAAIGAQIANPESRVICLNSDGGMMLNLQELQTIAHHQLPIKLVIFNNLGYAMIRHSQRTLFDGRYVGSDPTSGISFPDYSALVRAFGFEFIRLEDSAQITAAVKGFLDAEGTVVLEVMMHPEQLYIPRVGTIKSVNGSLISPPIEDMIPLVPEAVLSAAMNGALHSESIKIRSVPTALPTMEERS